MRIVIVGASGHGKVVLDAVVASKRHQVVGFLDRGLAVGTQVAGRPVLGCEQGADSVLPELLLSGKVEGGLVAIGDNDVRARVVAELAAAHPGFFFVTVVHPAAVVAGDVVLGPGSVVLAGAVLNPGCRIGAHCLLNTRCSLDHDSELGDFASLAPGVTVGGEARIGRGTAISLGANVLHGRRVGEYSVVGAGALVTRDLPERVVAYGVPARVIRPRQPGDRYL